MRASTNRIVSKVGSYTPRLIDAREPLAFDVTAPKGRTKDPTRCVLAHAIASAVGATADRVEVGSTITKIYKSDGAIVRYFNSQQLRECIRVFDKTGIWDLPPGTYRLRAVPKRHKRGARNRYMDQYNDDVRKKKRKKTRKTQQRQRTVERIVGIAGTVDILTKAQRRKMSAK